LCPLTATLVRYRPDLKTLVALVTVEAQDNALAFTPELVQVCFGRLSSKGWPLKHYPTSGRAGGLSEQAGEEVSGPITTRFPPGGGRRRPDAGGGDGRLDRAEDERAGQADTLEAPDQRSRASTISM
jgi:hypothetical protein